MAGPLIPFIDGASYEIPIYGALSIKPFGTLVAIGVYVGSWMTLRRTRERNLDDRKMNDFIFWVVAFGFVLSHMIDAVFYHPQRVMDDPLYLLRIWDGLSSYGGFIGAVIGALAWRFYRRKPVLELIDVCVSAFPTAWIFGRMGCSVVHDHPGAVSNAWYAVQYPANQLVEGYAGRFDLGLYEMVLTIPLALACNWLWRKNPRRANGFYVGLTLTAYAPVRFLLDFLRIEPSDVAATVADPRYAGLTPAQWACLPALALGVYFVRKTVGVPYVRQADAADEPRAEEADPEQPDGADEAADDVEEAAGDGAAKATSAGKTAENAPESAAPESTGGEVG